MNSKQIQILQQVLDEYGIEIQTLECCEKLGTLIKDIGHAGTKVINEKDKMFIQGRIATSMGEVIVAMKQLQLYYGITANDIRRETYWSVKRQKNSLTKRSKENDKNTHDR